MATDRIPEEPIETSCRVPKRMRSTETGDQIGRPPTGHRMPLSRHWRYPGHRRACGLNLHGSPSRNGRLVYGGSEPARRKPRLERSQDRPGQSWCP